jgi:hypothetical protein
VIPTRIRVLVVDDDPWSQQVIASQLMDGDDQIERSTSFLLMEGARLADERAIAPKKQ